MGPLWWRDAEILARRVIRAGGIKPLSREPDSPAYSTLQLWCTKHNIESPRSPGGQGYSDGSDKPGAYIKDDSATIVSTPSSTRTSPDLLLQNHGLSTDDWVVHTITVNEWEALTKNGNTETLSQIKVTLKRKIRIEDYITPPQPRKPGWSPRKPRHGRKVGVRGVLPVFPDPHFPLNQTTLTNAAVAWMSEFRPTHAVLLGDNLEFSAFARHPKNPRTHRTANECIHPTYHWLAALRAASPDTHILIIPGNHDWWLQRRVLERLPALYGIQLGGTNIEALSLRHLLRLDELHIDMIEPEGEYHDAVHPVLDDLVLLHGNYGGMNAAVKEFGVWEGTSIGQGHNHKTAINAITKRLSNNTEVQRYAISFGTMATRDLGYDPKRDVNQSFGVLQVHEDGRWHPELAYYDPQLDDVTWRGWRYAA